MKYHCLFPESKQELASLDHSVEERLSTFLTQHATLNLSTIFPQEQETPLADWSPEQVKALLNEANGVLETLTPAPTITTVPEQEVTKPVSDLSPGEKQLLTQVAHNSFMKDEQSWERFIQPAQTITVPATLDPATQQAREDLAQVTTFWSIALASIPQPVVILSAE